MQGLHKKEQEKKSSTRTPSEGMKKGRGLKLRACRDLKKGSLKSKGAEGGDSLAIFLDGGAREGPIVPEERKKKEKMDKKSSL